MHDDWRRTMRLMMMGDRAFMLCMVVRAIVRRRLLMHLGLVGRTTASVSAARSGEDSSADCYAHKTCNHEFVYVVVHNAPL